MGGEIWKTESLLVHMWQTWGYRLEMLQNHSGELLNCIKWQRKVKTEMKGKLIHSIILQGMVAFCQSSSWAFLFDVFYTKAQRESVEGVVSYLPHMGKLILLNHMWTQDFHLISRSMNELLNRSHSANELPCTPYNVNFSWQPLTVLVVMH